MDYGHTTTVQHEIPLVDPRPFRLPYRKIPPSQWQDVRRLLIEMETAGVVRPSKSPYASPVVVVTKKDGSLRLCIDYRKLNSCSTRDAFPLPRIEEALEALGQAKYFSKVPLSRLRNTTSTRPHSALPWVCLRPIECLLGCKMHPPPFKG